MTTPIRKFDAVIVGAGGSGLRAVPADSFASAHLKVATGTPLLCVDRIAFTYGDKPVEWRRGLCLTDGFSYFNELN